MPTPNPFKYTKTVRFALAHRDHPVPLLVCPPTGHFYLAETGHSHVALTQEMTVLDNAMVGALLRAPSLQEARDLAASTLDQIGLGAKKDILAMHLTLPDRKMLELGHTTTLAVAGRSDGRLTANRIAPWRADYPGYTRCGYS